MKLSKKAINQLKNRALMLKVAIALDFSEQWIQVLIKRNSKNGPLTTITSLKTIQAETGLSEEQLIDAEITIG